MLRRGYVVRGRKGEAGSVVPVLRGKVSIKTIFPAFEKIVAMMFLAPNCSMN